MAPSRCTRLKPRLASCFVPHEGPGLLAVLEGVPGAGKTTSIRRISEHRRAKIIPQLDHTLEQETIAKDIIQGWYIQAELERQAVIRKSLELPRLILQDRNIISTLAFAFASALRYKVNGAFAEVLKTILSKASGSLIYPDLLIILKVDPLVGLSRRRKLGEPQAEFWRDGSFLSYHASFYSEYISVLPAKEVVVLDTSNLTLKETVASINLQLDINIKGPK